MNGGPALADAVHFGTNRSLPIHRWFHFKEGFAANLFTIGGIDLSDLERDDAIFLDPFCGSGTTLLSGDLEHRWPGLRIGFEINPFVAFVARTKTSWRTYDTDTLNRIRTELLTEPLSSSIADTKWPALSTFRNETIFAPARVSALVDATERARKFAEPERDLLLLGIAAAAERVSYFRKDGRALRIIRSPAILEERKRVCVESMLSRIWSLYEDDLHALQNQRIETIGQSHVIQGDGRLLSIPADAGYGDGDVTLITYSPPYLNHIDYTEVYKVESWLLGFITSSTEMLKLRKETFRSHGSIAIGPANSVLDGDAAEALKIAVEAVTNTGTLWHEKFERVAYGYMADIHQSLSRQYELLKPGGRAVCVVANSAHGASQNRVPIAVDLFIAEIASSIGFAVEKIAIARQLSRRDHLNLFLRESMLVFRKPHGV